MRIDPTPNPNARKVTVDRILSERAITISEIGQATGNPLAAALLVLPGVSSVFFFKNYCTVTKRPDGDWSEIEPTVESAFRANL